MRKILASAALSALMLVTTASVASAAPGTAIKDACGVSFGQLIGPANAGGSSAHTNDAGGAAAFADPVVLAAHGCTG
jgi:hypothetical protein